MICVFLLLSFHVVAQATSSTLETELEAAYLALPEAIVNGHCSPSEKGAFEHYFELSTEYLRKTEASRLSAELVNRMGTAWGLGIAARVVSPADCIRVLDGAKGSSSAVIAEARCRVLLMSGDRQAARECLGGLKDAYRGLAVGERALGELVGAYHLDGSWECVVSAAREYFETYSVGAQGAYVCGCLGEAYWRLGQMGELSGLLAIMRDPTRDYVSEDPSAARQLLAEVQYLYALGCMASGNVSAVRKLADAASVGGSDERVDAIVRVLADSASVELLHRGSTKTPSVHLVGGGVHSLAIVKLSVQLAKVSSECGFGFHWHPGIEAGPTLQKNLLKRFHEVHDEFNDSVAVSVKWGPVALDVGSMELTSEAIVVVVDDGGNVAWCLPLACERDLKSLRCVLLQVRRR